MSASLRRIREEDLELIRKWRMSEAVTRYMNTNPKLTPSGQKKWFASIQKNPCVSYWLIEVDQTPAGVINLADIDYEKGTCVWAYYIGEEKLRSLKLAISLEMSLYDYVFDVLDLKELQGIVFKLNEGVWKLHLACGSRIVREVRGEVVKEGVAYDIVHMSITKEEWNRIREKKKYDRICFEG